MWWFCWFRANILESSLDDKLKNKIFFVLWLCWLGVNVLNASHSNIFLTTWGELWQLLVLMYGIWNWCLGKNFVKYDGMNFTLG
jgi:hypothetical protein